MRKTLLALFVVFATTDRLSADLIFSHAGATAPTDEGWIHTDVAGQPSGPVFNDLATGIDAWSVEDNSTSVTGDFYSQTLSSAQSAAVADGWTLSTTLRVVEGTTSMFDSPFVAYSQGTKEFTVVFDRQADGDPTVRLSEGGTSGQTFALEGVGNTYHTYELTFDSVAGTADLFVDGVQRISNYGGQNSSTSRVAWGMGASDGTGHVHFNEVTFRSTAIPEPSSIGLIGACAGAFFFRRRFGSLLSHHGWMRSVIQSLF